MQDDRVSLADCPVGLFLWDGILCLKTEYGGNDGGNDGRIDAFIVSSGEFFWGSSPQTVEHQRVQLVSPLDLDAVMRDVMALA